MTASRFILDAVVAASAALLLAWLAGLALRRAPAALRHAVWRIAVLAFWLAPAAAIAADALHLPFCPVPARPAARVQFERRSPLPPSQLRNLVPWPGAYWPTHPGPRPEPAAIRPPVRPSPLVLSLIAWAAGTALSAACFVWHLRALARLLRTTSPVPEAALSERVAHWSARVGLRSPPTLARSSALTVPTIAGWRKPLLLLPPSFSTADPSCDAVLVHELAHIRRADLVAQTAARVTRALWWWHPLAWLAARELHTSAEEACDDWAVALTEQRRTYADHLVRWAEAARTGGALAYTCGGKALIGRVRRILAQTGAPDLRPSRRAAALLATCALATILAAAVLRAQPPPMSEPAPQEEQTVSTPDRSQGIEVLPDELVQLAGRKFAESLGDDYIYQAGLPTAYVQALNHAGIDIDFADFAAMSGWAFSFGYTYDDISTAYLAVRGSPGGDGPYEAFQIAEWFGLAYESARTEEKDELWAFVQKHIDAGTPIISEHYDGGLICGHREKDGKREVWFAVDPPSGEPAWVDINDLHPYEVCALVKKGDPLPKRELYLKALQRAVMYATPHNSGGVPQGLAALEAYAADVADPSKDFAGCGEHFCWATFERLEARRCAAVWLERAAEELDQFFGLGAAVARYQHAYDLYDEYRKAVGGGDPDSGIAPEQLRSPAKIAQIAPLLRRAITEERAGLHEISVALADHATESP
jgi:beta-lactamase regulating signal transducer with metallopeptidase domain